MQSNKTETVEIYRFTGAVIFTAEVEAGLSTVGLKLGAAVKIAVKAGANLVGADLRDANLVGADLRDANLVGADLRDANLWSTNLRDANLVGADLAGAYLGGADLRSANLRSANLRSANLAGADLAGAYLGGANLEDAYLGGADLRSANLRSAKSLLDCGTPYGWRVVVIVHDDGIRILAGCRWFTFQAAFDHWYGREDRKLMQPLLAYIKAACEINGWPLGEER